MDGEQILSIIQILEKCSKFEFVRKIYHVYRNGEWAHDDGKRTRYLWYKEVWTVAIGEILIMNCQVESRNRLNTVGGVQQYRDLFPVATRTKYVHNLQVTK